SGFARGQSQTRGLDDSSIDCVAQCPSLEKEGRTMAVQLNHTIVSAHDKQASANFLAEILGLPTPAPFGPFVMVQADNDVTLDFLDSRGEIAPQHYAFLVTEREFDVIFGRIRERGLSYW